MILQTILSGLRTVHQIRDNVDAWAAAQAAYNAGAAFPGFVLAYTGATKTGVDDLAPAAIMELVDSAYDAVVGAARTLEGASQAIAGAIPVLDLASRTVAGLALEVRELEAFLAKLRGNAPLREILEPK